MTNENFGKLIEVINRKNYKFPFEVRDYLGVRGVAEIRKRILAERKEGSTETIDFIGKAFNDQQIQEILNLNKPQISDLGTYLGVESGKVYGLEFRLMGPSDSHKDLMVASLLLTKFMTPGLPKKEMDTITDAGFFNSALATKFYSNYFGLKGAYFIQKSTPKRLIERLQDTNFEVNLISNEGTGHDQKNATYMALLKRFYKDTNFKKRAYHLGHAELGQFVVQPIGRNFADLLKEKGIKPDIFVSPIGAGTTIMGIGEPLQDEFGLDLAIGEYAEYTPVADKFNISGKIIDEYPSTVSEKIKNSVTERDNLVRGVISRQLELNPFIPEDFWKKVNHFYQLAPSIDTAVLKHIRQQGYDVGITTAGTMAIAASLVINEGKTVLIPIFEKFRDYHPNDKPINPNS